MKRKFKMLFSLILVFLVLNISYSQQGSKDNSNNKKSSLHRLSDKGLAVLSSVSEIGMIYGIPKMFDYQHFIEDEVKNKLKNAGLEIAEYNENLPYLLISILILPYGTEQEYIGFYYTITISINQKVILHRDKNIQVSASTWSRSDVGYASKKDGRASTLNHIYRKVDEFIIEYLKANQR